MVESVLHLFKIHRKVIFGNSSVIVQNMLCITPKSLNAVDMVLAAIGKGFAVVQAMVLAEPVQRVVAAEGIGVINRPFSGMLSDMGHEFVSRYPLNHLRIYPAIPLQKPKYNAFACRAPSTLALASAAEVGLVNLNLAFELARFQFRHMINRFAQALVHSGDRLVVHADIGRQAIGGLLLVKTGNDRDFFAELFERLLFSTGLVSASHIAARGPAYLERTAENALSAPRKVGRTVENVLLTCSHKGILPLDGYEYH